MTATRRQAIFSGLMGLSAVGISWPALGAEKEKQSAVKQIEPLGGQPAPGSKSSVADLDYQVKYQRAFEAVIWAVPALGIYGFTKGFNALGLKPNEIIAYAKPATPHLEALTINNQVPYIFAYTDLRDGPVVLEIPAATEEATLYGQIVDCWQVTVGDVVSPGIDRGKSGKYLLLPPGYDKPISDGYFPIQTSSFRIYLAFRSVPGLKGNLEKAATYARAIKMYPLSRAENPPETTFLDPGDQRFPTLPAYDESAFKDIYDIVSVEPVRPRDKIMMGMLASIGIEPGKPFNPDEKTRKAMKAAIVDAYFYLRQRFENPRTELLYWPDRKYINYLASVDANGGFTYETSTSLSTEDRAWIYFVGTYYPNKIAARPTAIYLSPYADAAGKALQAGKTYRITIPKDVPVGQFWSVVVYDAADFAFIYSQQMLTGLSSFDLPSMKLNKDESVTIYIGPKAPAGFASNWIPTEGKKPLPMIRFYSPTERFWNKSFKLPDFELVS
jgi:hypothetical protein